MMVKTIGIDLAKDVFGMQGVDAGERRWCIGALRESTCSACWQSWSPAWWVWRRVARRTTGRARSRSRPNGEADESAVREALSTRMTPTRCRGDLRGGEPAVDALRAGQVHSAAGPAGLASGTRAAAALFRT
jgi:hypothetical protein